jgi:hypothetical protein
MWCVRRVDVAHALAAEVDDCAVGQCPRRAVARVVEPNHATKGAVRHLPSALKRAARVSADPHPKARTATAWIWWRWCWWRGAT